MKASMNAVVCVCMYMYSLIIHIAMKSTHARARAHTHTHTHALLQRLADNDATVAATHLVSLSMECMGGQGGGSAGAGSSDTRKAQKAAADCTLLMQPAPVRPTASARGV